MSGAGTISFDESTGRIAVESLEIADEELVRFLQEYDEDRRAEMATEALRIGLRTMQLMETSQEVEYVERRLGELENELANEVDEFKEELDEKLGDDGALQTALENHVGENGTLQERIESAFDDGGPFMQALNDELGENGGRIQQALDPDQEGSPTYRLEQRLRDEIESLRERLVEDEARQEMRDRTYLAGGDFEDDVQDILNEIVRQTPNNVEFTGDTTGEIGRDVGDFVMTLAETQQRIVIEAKTEGYSLQDIKDEMEEAIQNRNAAYGVFVTDSLANLPRTKTGWFHEFPEQDTVVVAMSEMDEEEIEPGYLRIAINWARMRAVQSYAEVGSSFDPDDLRAELKEIEEEIGQFQTVRGRCTEIRKSANRIEETLQEIEESILSRITEVETELTKAHN